ncbi:MAG: type I 3-dehydroquinate dehydratase [Methanothrix sp.]|nr:type I 3-dehydroquinate dehydratase [Methanothrix sp.]OYV10371.1 MAG: 3-dehydroquinate dehydratase I [Methanosaeta sp. NSP1]
MMGRSAVVAVLGECAERLLPLAGEADIIELRLDLLSESDPLETLKAVRKATAKPIIATARHRSEGGGFQGSEEQRSELLTRAAVYSDYVDVEELLQWCNKRGVPVNGESRSSYAADKLREIIIGH